MRRLDRARDAMLVGVDGLDMFDRAARQQVARTSYSCFAEHHLHRVEWRCRCAQEDRRAVQSLAETSS